MSKKIRRVNVIDVGNVKTVTDKFQRGEEYRDQVDDINFRDHEPIGAGYIAAWLRHYGFEAEIIWPRSDVISLEEALAGNPQAVCFSSLTFNYPKTKALAEKLRLARPEVTTVIGGYHATSAPLEVSAETINSQPLFDFVVAGEGELNVGEILRYQSGQLVRENIDGMVYRDGQPWVSKLRRFDPRQNTTPLRPRAKMLNSRRYGLYYPAPSQQCGVALFVWSRGCRYNCSFCCSKRMFPLCQGQPAVLYRDIGDIVEEIRFCQREYGTNFGFSVDLNAPGTAGDKGHGESWLKELCREIGKTGLKWYAMCRLDVNPAYFEIMRDGGCTQIGFGVESLTNRLKSGTKLSVAGWKKLAVEVASHLREIGVQSKFYYILGGLVKGRPYTVEDIRAEGREILEVDCDTIRLSWMVYPLYSPEFAGLRDAGLLEGGGRDYSLMSTEFPLIKVAGVTAAELQALRTKIMREFFCPKRYSQHAWAQIKRVPEWEKSFLEFNHTLGRQLGQGWNG